MSVTRQLIINGEHVPAESGRTTEDLSPWTGEPYAHVAAASPDDVTRAVDAAEGGYVKSAAIARAAWREIVSLEVSI
jgi:acyl-CoA reductase-like NAD-dependent aldehyde dehydrogenase